MIRITKYFDKHQEKLMSITKIICVNAKVFDDSDAFLPNTDRPIKKKEK